MLVQGNIPEAAGAQPLPHLPGPARARPQPRGPLHGAGGLESSGPATVPRPVPGCRGSRVSLLARGCVTSGNCGRRKTPPQLLPGAAGARRSPAGEMVVRGRERFQSILSAPGIFVTERTHMCFSSLQKYKIPPNPSFPLNQFPNQSFPYSSFLNVTSSPPLSTLHVSSDLCHLSSSFTTR